MLFLALKSLIIHYGIDPFKLHNNYLVFSIWFVRYLIVQEGMKGRYPENTGTSALFTFILGYCRF